MSVGPAASSPPLPVLFYADTYRSAALLHASGFLAPDPFLFLEHFDERVILTSALEVGRARKESRAATVRELNEFGLQELLASGLSSEDAMSEAVARFLEATGLRAFAVPRDFPLFLADALRARGFVVSVDRSLHRRRRRKDAREIAAIEETQRAAEDSLAVAADALRRAHVAADGTLVLEGGALTSERLRALVEATLLERGCAADGTILAPGTQGADPHAVGSGPLSAGEPIVLDIFPQHKTTRFFGDLSRTLCRGDPPDEIVRMYDAVRRAQEEAIAAIRPGVSGRTVHELAEDVLYEAGYATLRDGQRREGVARFIHGTGHGVGLEIHEAPTLGRGGSEPLAPGDVVTVEPGLYDPRVGGVRLEDVVVVTEVGCRNLTLAPKTLVV